MPEYVGQAGAENSTGTRPRQLTPRGRERFPQPGQHRALVLVLDQRDPAIAGHHRAAAFRIRRAVEADHGDSVAVARGGDLVAHTERRS